MSAPVQSLAGKMCLPVHNHVLTKGSPGQLYFATQPHRHEYFVRCLMPAYNHSVPAQNSPAFRMLVRAYGIELWMAILSYAVRHATLE